MMALAPAYVCVLLFVLLQSNMVVALAFQRTAFEHAAFEREAKKERPVALIMMHAIRWTEYMYEPAVSTLRVAFENAPQEIDVRIPSPVMANEPGSRENLIAELGNQTANLGRGDIVVFMGKLGQNIFVGQVPNFRAKGIYTVFYNADPLPGCQMDASQVDEIWDFSHRTIRNCAQRGALNTRAPGPPQRFVPLGALETPKVVYSADFAHANVQQRMNFFGHVTASRQKCFEKLVGLTSEMNLKLESTCDVWDDDGFKALLSTTDIFLNLNHRCDMNDTFTEKNRQPVFWRVPKLINAHGLVISEPCWPEDAAEFEGLVDFVPFSKIPKKFAELAALPAQERQRLGDERAKLFARKFAPKHIFERASIFSLLTCLQDPSCDPKTTLPTKV
eukprot:TRINITY_DN2772_c0_g2_i1.p1 TRINITY_DN2772_c0_g2~~TRINITY_DN2772_c0_g2_i1.p1  ORF type:complete len:390 (-),score=64.56 TRINITY_DN2772_c0_g2_i1:86-1255(-)